MVVKDFCFLVVTETSSCHHRFSDQYCPSSQNPPFCLLVQICTGIHFYNVQIGCTHGKSRYSFLFQTAIVFCLPATYYSGYYIDLLDYRFRNGKNSDVNHGLSDLHFFLENDLCCHPVCLLVSGNYFIQN